MSYSPRKRKSVSESVFLNGVEFRRYPNAKKTSDRVYFRPGASDFIRGVEAYHRELWKLHRGPIPEGCHIHHKDGNPLNNDISNLECITSHAHKSMHGDDTKSKAYLEARRANMEKARVEAAKWHGSKDGKRWHSKHSKDIWKSAVVRTFVCQVCGKSFESRKPGDGNKFCSNNCKSSHRRRTGADKVTRTCANCGKEFEVNKYSITKCCSLSCAATLRNKTRRA